MNFYTIGKNAAFNKLGQGGFLRSLGQTAQKTWKGMEPAAQGIAKRLGAGGATGAVGGALAGGEDHPLLGALAGGTAGALGMGALGHKLQGKATRGVAKSLWEHAPKEMAKKELRPLFQQAKQHLESRILPGISRY